MVPMLAIAWSRRLRSVMEQAKFRASKGMRGLRRITKANCQPSFSMMRLMIRSTSFSSMTCFTFGFSHLRPRTNTVMQPHQMPRPQESIPATRATLAPHICWKRMLPDISQMKAGPESDVVTQQSRKMTTAANGPSALDALIRSSLAWTSLSFSRISTPASTATAMSAAATWPTKRTEKPSAALASPCPCPSSSKGCCEVVDMEEGTASTGKGARDEGKKEGERQHPQAQEA
mmetsp:Transcript_74023/g.165660  ORF Transcript_74023/g.165660 Transcript_74023/m.165660 type:complete len:232 (+) Transcript_74023:372-1067(+)